MALQPGATLGPYEILSFIGAGGMGEVYLAREQVLGRRVALKVLPPEFTHDAHRIARFEQEARSASALSHPNICTIFALGELPDGRHFIAMEYIDGHTLRHRLSADHLSLRDALDISSQIAAGVSAAHAVGIIHRDLKPENVVIRPDGLVKVVDFGLAKLALPTDAHGGGTTHLEAKTDPGSAVGTIAYMSPEQARAQEVDARTDVWSLGVLLYEMVAGRTPFGGKSSSDVLAAILERDPPPLARFDPDAPAELQRILSKALRKDREQRYQGMKDLLLDLQALRDDRGSQASSSDADAQSPVSGTTPTPAVSTGVAPRSQSSAEYVVAGLARHKVFAALGAGILAMIIGGAWWAIRNRPTGSEGLQSTAPVVHRTLTRLTFGPGLQTDVTWSPDGRLVAYAADRSGSFDLWVQSVVGGEPVQVTKSAAHETQPDWSPDSSMIAYRSEADGGGIHVVPALGGAERRLAAGGYRPRFSPDGAQVMYLSSLEHETTNVALPDVYLVATQGGAPRRLFENFWHQVDSFQSISWHPDGVRLSFTGSYLNKPAGFFTVRVTDGLPTASQMHEQVAQRLEIGSEISGEMAASPRVKLEEFRWSPSASRLFFVGSFNGLRNLWSVEVDPGTLEWRSGPYQLTSGPGSDVRPAPSADGRRIAFTTRSETTRVWVIPFDDRRGRTSGDGEPVSPSDFILKNFDLSRDGKKLAFVGVLPGASRTQLWEVALDTGERTLRLSDAIGRSFLRYSHSASALAYLVERAPPMIRTIRASAIEEQTVTQAELIFPFDWALDDTAIIGSSTTNSAAPWYVAAWPIDAAPHAEKRVTVVLRDAQLSLWGARYSPDGKWLCFNAHAAKGNSVVGVASVSGPPDRPWSRVTDGHDWADKPRWSPDGRSLYYISSAEEGIYNLHRVEFDPQTGRTVGAPTQITSFRSPARTISPHLGDGELGVAPGRLALTILEASGSIWMLDNVDR